ncbi:MAG TPA: hypothetical protein VNU97_08190 [Rhizomicrobium sp.]|jgi:hypothetical protein|nr:hypothetical protein [Rhizomicrobium sp.]
MDDDESTDPVLDPAPNPASFFYRGTIAERVDMQLGVLTQGVADCMILATGAFPNLTEGAAQEPNALARPSVNAVTSWQAARSAELRDAARLAEASARLLTGFARLRGQFSQDFTIRHSDRRAGAKAKHRQRATTVVHSFSLPAAPGDGAGELPSPASGLSPGLADIAQRFAAEMSARHGDGQSSDAAVEELERRLAGLAGKGWPAPASDDAAPASDTPHPPEAK